MKKHAYISALTGIYVIFIMLITVAAFILGCPDFSGYLYFIGVIIEFNLIQWAIYMAIKAMVNEYKKRLGVIAGFLIFIISMVLTWISTKFIFSMPWLPSLIISITNNIALILSLFIFAIEAQLYMNVYEGEKQNG